MYVKCSWAKGSQAKGSCPGASALSRRTRVWLLVYVLVLLTQITAEIVGAAAVSWIGLIVAMPVLIVALLTTGLHREPVGRWLLVGLVFSWFGDALGWFILIKIVLFLGAQICYLAAFWPFRRRMVHHPAALLAYVAVIALLVVVVGREAGWLVPAVVVYGVALGLMAVLSTGAGRLTGLGGAIFVVSDAVLGVDTFVERWQVPGAEALIMITYLTAQLLLVLGVLRSVRATGGRRRHRFPLVAAGH